MTKLDLDDLEAKAKAAGGDQWSVQWFECKADSDDVRHTATKPLKQGEKRELLSVGDVLWRVPHQIGPISPDHCHWAGNHLACSEEEAEFAASANPSTILALVDRIRELEEMNERQRARETQLVEALKPLVDAAYNLSFGEDWNNGTEAKLHGNRRKLIMAIPSARAQLDGLSKVNTALDELARLGQEFDAS